MNGIVIETKTNGYKAPGIQQMIGKFEKVASILFPGCLVRHFYYASALWIPIGRDRLYCSNVGPTLDNSLTATDGVSTGDLVAAARGRRSNRKEGDS